MYLKANKESLSIYCKDWNSRRTQKRKSYRFAISKEAEDEGFKPPIPKKGIPDFESSAFGHSANLPNLPCKSKHNSAIFKILDHLILWEQFNVNAQLCLYG